MPNWHGVLLTSPIGTCVVAQTVSRLRAIWSKGNAARNVRLWEGAKVAKARKFARIQKSYSCELAFQNCTSGYCKENSKVETASETAKTAPKESKECGCLGLSWGLLGKSLGCLGGLLGLSWEGIGASWGPLGEILAIKPENRKGDPFLEQCWVSFGRVLGGFLNS